MKKIILLFLAMAQLQATQESKVLPLRLLCFKALFNYYGQESLNVLHNISLNKDGVLDLINFDRQIADVKAVQGNTVISVNRETQSIEYGKTHSIKWPSYIFNITCAPDEKHILLRDWEKIILQNVQNGIVKTEFDKKRVVYIGFDKYRNIMIHKQGANFFNQDESDEFDSLLLYSFNNLHHSTTLLRERSLEILDYLKGSHRLLVRKPGRNYSVFDIKKRAYLYDLLFLKDLEITSLAIHSRKNTDIVVFREDQIEHAGSSDTLLLYALKNTQAELMNALEVNSNCCGITAAAFDKTGNYLAVSTDELPPKLHIYEVKSISDCYPNKSLIIKTIPIPFWNGRVRLQLKWPNNLYIIKDSEYFCVDMNFCLKLKEFQENKK